MATFSASGVLPPPLIDVDDAVGMSHGEFGAGHSAILGFTSDATSIDVAVTAERRAAGPLGLAALIGRIVAAIKALKKGRDLKRRADAAKKAKAEKEAAEKAAQEAGKQGARSLDDLESLRGASPKQLEDLIPKNYVKSQVRTGEGVKFADPARRGDQIRIMRGDPSAVDPLHRGPYAVISRSGRVTRIPLEGNPTLP